MEIGADEARARESGGGWKAKLFSASHLAFFFSPRVRNKKKCCCRGEPIDVAVDFER
jgi:hypothetical protein